MSSAISHLLNSQPLDWQAVLDATIKDFECTTGTLHRLDPETRLLHLVAQRGIPEQLLPVVQTIPVGKGIAGVAAETRQPVELCNLQKDLGGVAKENARQTNVQGSLAVPILKGDELCGTIGVGKMVPHDFTDEEKSRLMFIAEQLAPFLAPAASQMTS